MVITDDGDELNANATDNVPQSPEPDQLNVSAKQTSDDDDGLLSVTVHGSSQTILLHRLPSPIGVLPSTAHSPDGLSVQPPAPSQHAQ